MLKAGVIGVGHLGRFHALKYKDLSNVELIGVYDVNFERAKQIAEECNTKAFSDVLELAKLIDLASVATPATSHFEITKLLLNNNVHCLVEKPFTRTSIEAKELDKLAKEKKLIIQVGHLERFNTVASKANELIDHPIFAECHRLSGFTARSTDIDVIFDIMVHDIDLILGIFKSEIKSIDAIGVPVLTDKVDIANAKIEFMNGAVVNLTASRISDKVTRKMRLFQKYSYVGLDFQKGDIDYFKRVSVDGKYSIVGEKFPLGTTDALKLEIESFINSVEHNSPVAVTATEAIRVIQIAEQINQIIQSKCI